MGHSDSVRGFTLIELLVVIAIIGILSSVVLSALNTARGKSTDVSIKSNLSQSRTQAGLFYDAASANFSNVCASTSVNGVKSIYTMVQAAATSAGLAGFTRDGIGDATTAVCNDTTASWAAQVPLVQTPASWFCVDSTGVAGVYSTSRITSTTDRGC